MTYSLIGGKSGCGWIPSKSFSEHRHIDVLLTVLSASKPVIYVLTWKFINLGKRTFGYCVLA